VDVDLSLLRGFEMNCDGAVVPVMHSAQRLVAFVAVRDRPVRRELVSGTLWCDTSEQRANSSLRSALWRVPRPGGRPVIRASNSHLWLDDHVRVDFRETIRRAEAYCQAVPGGDHGPRPFDLETCGFEDDLLPDWYEDWVMVERERFRQMRLHALERACDLLTRQGRYAAALRVGLAAVSCEPLRESAHRQVIKVHIGEGNVVEALRQYRSYAALIATELGVEPTESMRQLIRTACPRQAVAAAVSVG
jgi:DNA-binding SARP family transcriptional activator